MSTDLTAELAELRLTDHHVHSALRAHPDSAADLAGFLTESDRPPPEHVTPFDSQLGFAVRRHCAPLLGLPAHASPEEYWAARSALTPGELTERMLRAAGVDHWLVDTGFGTDRLLSLAELEDRSGGRAHEIVRLESVLEGVAAGTEAGDLRARFTEALGEAVRHARGLKSIIAYRHGFGFDPKRPTDGEVTAAAGRWLGELDAGAPARVTDPVLLRMALWAGVDTGLPLQLHVGFGDPDLALERCDPLLLSGWLRAVEGSGSDVLLLHCYPFQRSAGFLAHAFPHVYFDVGLAVNYTGAASPAVLAESLELAPFGKILYSSDAWGPPELHYLGARLWRRGMARALTRWVDEGEWAAADALRVARLVGRENAARVYGVDRD
ncbi:amidohydrolase [Streptomyces sp. AJS327]|uniref:amidohydrolase family protein n=1 Tax=Streptomyces sp. AJS327 TaxID=2545265 RepID=UPI0015E008CD|nr:amidohydrolase family protein [Streptomyces sp. AJS327]MBA0051116.1 amidohydrolase [Streptomyces sp. AJS327]